MSGRIDDGGPAFPSTNNVELGGFVTPGHQGMSLRDFFAAQAMHAHLITDTVPGEACNALVEAADNAGREPMDHLCFNAYEVADAMLRARGQS